MADSDIHKKLYNASDDSNSTRVRELLAAGADPNRYTDSTGYTALIQAAWRGRDSIVSLLIKHGADLDIQHKGGWTALFMAAGRGHNLVAKRLIKAGADLNIQNKDGETALHRAANEGHNEVTTTLMEAGADPSIPNNEGKTPIQVANGEIARLE